MGPLNFYEGARVMMTDLESQILAAFQEVLPLKVIMNVVFMFMGFIFLFHLIEGVYNAGKSGHHIDAYNIIKDFLRRKALRLLVYSLLALGALLVTNGGPALLMNAQNQHSWATINTTGQGPGHEDLATDWGLWLIDWMGTNTIRDVTITNPDGTTKVVKVIQTEAPPIQALKAATKKASAAVDGLEAVDIYDRIDGEIRQHMGLGSQNMGMGDFDWGTGNYLDIVSVGQTFLLRQLIDGFLYVVNKLAFLWAQWTLCRTLVVQCLFMQMSWHLGLYFLPLFILMAYFKTTHGFLVNLLINYAAMMIACYVMASVASMIFDKAVWLGTKNAAGVFVDGVIPNAFDNVKLAANDTVSQYVVGSFPWVARTFARQIARGQIIWLLGAVGLILGHVYEMVRGILGGSFRSYFNPGSAGTGALFGGK